eukprot:3364355-Amphidinium_carterae.1
MGQLTPVTLRVFSLNPCKTSRSKSGTRPSYGIPHQGRLRGNSLQTIPPRRCSVAGPIHCLALVRTIRSKILTESNSDSNFVM